MEAEAARGAPSRVVCKAIGRAAATTGRSAAGANGPCHRRRALAAVAIGLRRARGAPSGGGCMSLAERGTARLRQGAATPPAAQQRGRPYARANQDRPGERRGPRVSTGLGDFSWRRQHTLRLTQSRGLAALTAESPPAPTGRLRATACRPGGILASVVLAPRGMRGGYRALGSPREGLSRSQGTANTIHSFIHSGDRGKHLGAAPHAQRRR